MANVTPNLTGTASNVKSPAQSSLQGAAAGLQGGSDALANVMQVMAANNQSFLQAMLQLQQQQVQSQQRASEEQKQVMAQTFGKMSDQMTSAIMRREEHDRAMERDRASSENIEGRQARGEERRDQREKENMAIQAEAERQVQQEMQAMTERLREYDQAIPAINESLSVLEGLMANEDDPEVAAGLSRLIADARKYRGEIGAQHPMLVDLANQYRTALQAEISRNIADGVSSDVTSGPNYTPPPVPRLPLTDEQRELLKSLGPVTTRDFDLLGSNGVADVHGFRNYTTMIQLDRQMDAIKNEAQKKERLRNLTEAALRTNDLNEAQIERQNNYINLFEADAPDLIRSALSSVDSMDFAVVRDEDGNITGEVPKRDAAYRKIVDKFVSQLGSEAMELHRRIGGDYDQKKAVLTTDQEVEYALLRTAIDAQIHTKMDIAIAGGEGLGAPLAKGNTAADFNKMARAVKSLSGPASARNRAYSQPAFKQVKDSLNSARALLRSVGLKKYDSEAQDVGAQVAPGGFEVAPNATVLLDEKGGVNTDKYKLNFSFLDGLINNFSGEPEFTLAQEIADVVDPMNPKMMAGKEIPRIMQLTVPQMDQSTGQPTGPGGQPGPTWNQPSVLFQGGQPGQSMPTPQMGRTGLTSPLPTPEERDKQLQDRLNSRVGPLGPTGGAAPLPPPGPAGLTGQAAGSGG